MPPEIEAPKPPTEDEVRGMGEEELLKLSGIEPVTPPTGQQDPPPAPPVEKTAPGDTGHEGTPGTGTPSPEANKEGEAEPVAPAPSEVVYAGKYKSPEALVDGMRELAKKLTYPYDEHAERLIEAALASKSYKDLESAYAKYEQELGKRSATPSPAQPSATPAKAEEGAASEAGTLSEAETREIQEGVKGVFTQRLALHPVMRRFAEASEQVPRNRQELNELAARDFVLAQSYMDALVEVKEAVASEFAEIGKLKSSLPTLTQTAVAEGTAALKAFSEKHNLKLTEAEIAAVVAEGMASADPLVVETKHGFAVPRAGGLLRWFKAEKLDAMIERIRLASESEGRRKHLEDLEKMKGKSRESIGTAAIPHRKVETETRTVDLKDPDQVRELNEEQLLATLK